MSKPRLLVVDDGDRYIELFHALLRDYDYVTRCELSGPCWECPSRKGCTLTHAHDWAETQQALARSEQVDAILRRVAARGIIGTASTRSPSIAKLSIHHSSSPTAKAGATCAGATRRSRRRRRSSFPGSMKRAATGGS